jgi:peptidyl-prolyl cis-trans isomerase C
MLQFLREPLLHFVVIAAILFLIFDWRNEEAAPATEHEIVLTEDDLLQIALPMRAQGFPDPTPEQMRSLIETKVREEVLYREALAMGLDANDTIIKRRLAQKMDFLAEDLSDLRKPTEAELRQWLATHTEVFIYPPRVSFHHLYFSFDEHALQAQALATQALFAVAQQPAAPAGIIGDVFMFQDAYAERTPAQVAMVFGGPFATALFSLEPGAWSGPVESGYGWHLVYIDALAPQHIPEFEEVDPEVRMEWMANQRAQFKEAAYDAMRAKYKLVLPDTSGVAGQGDAPLREISNNASQ